MRYHVDGFTLHKNPSAFGGGYTITDENGSLLSRECFLKEGFTNNDGELLAIYSALKIAKNGDSILSDSSVCIGWVERGRTNRKKLKFGGGITREDLLPLIRVCFNLAKQKKISLIWTPREENLAGNYNEMHPYPFSGPFEEYPVFEDAPLSKPETVSLFGTTVVV